MTKTCGLPSLQSTPHVFDSEDIVAVRVGAYRLGRQKNRDDNAHVSASSECADVGTVERDVKETPSLGRQ